MSGLGKTTWEEGSIPGYLRSLVRWVFWVYVQRGAKWTKVPRNPHTGGAASVTDPVTWADYGTAASAACRHNGGVGIILGEGLVGIDLDDCIDADGKVEVWAQEIVDSMKSYTELSPSRRGIHIYVRGLLPAGRRKKEQVELYDRDRFFCVTGLHLPRTPKTVEERTRELARLHKRVFGFTAPSALSGSETTASRQLPNGNSEGAADALAQFRSAMTAAGLMPPGEIIADGKFRRFPTKDRDSDRAGWYVLRLDGVPGGAFGDWRTGLSDSWHADIGRPLTAVEAAADRRRGAGILKAREADEEQARRRAAEIWEAATPAAKNHPYLARKGISADGLRVHADNRLVVPIRTNGELHSLQFIRANGDKIFLEGGRVKGCYHVIGTIDGAAELCIAEGYATGATIHAATNLPVVVAFNAGNLLAVAETMRATFPTRPIVVCADDDAHQSENPGLTKATEAAAAVGGKLAVPDFGADRPPKATDFNDLRKLRGVEVVAEQIRNAHLAAPEPLGDRQVDHLIHIGTNGVELFRSGTGELYATYPVDGHRETDKIRGEFPHWLRNSYYEIYNKVPAAQAVENALKLLEAKASRGATHTVNNRIAGHEGNIYIDLSNKGGEAIKITATGWEVIHSVPVKFRRNKNARPLPHPVRGGSLNELRPFLNVATADEWRGAVGWLLQAARPGRSYMILILVGEQGSAKSTVAAVLKSILDPVNEAPSRALPREERDLAIAKRNGHVLIFSNISNIPPWISDALCRIATGEGYTTRKLYTDDDEVVLGGASPIILNGIENFAYRSDLLDRAIQLTLLPIAETARIDDTAFWSKFDAALPRILGALCSVLSRGLRNLPNVKVERLPRMADPVKWILACEEALRWKPGTFLKAFAANQESSVEIALEASPVAAALRSWLTKEKISECSLTASDLLEKLCHTHQFAEQWQMNKSWPQNARALAGRLRRDAPALRQSGIDLRFKKEGKGEDRQRVIHIRVTGADANAQGGRKADAKRSGGERRKMPETTRGMGARADANAQADAKFPHLSTSVREREKGGGGGKSTSNGKVKEKSRKFASAQALPRVDQDTAARGSRHIAPPVICARSRRGDPGFVEKY